MRSLAILTLTMSFAAAVVLPNECSTDDLPAARGKQVVVKMNSHSAKPNKSGPAAAVVLAQIAGAARCSGCVPRIRQDAVLPPLSQHSSPLLI
jgi:hypothetical protein